MTFDLFQNKRWIQFFRHLKYFIDLCGHIIQAHFRVSKIPSLLKTPLTITIVLITIGYATIVTEPDKNQMLVDIVAFIYEAQRERLVKGAGVCCIRSVAAITILEEKGKFIHILRFQ